MKQVSRDLGQKPGRTLHNFRIAGFHGMSASLREQLAMQVPLLINDRLDVALIIGADWVHVACVDNAGATAGSGRLDTTLI